MLSDATFNGIYDVVSSIFEAPERQLVMWIEQNTKYFQEFDKWYAGLSATNVYLDTQDREHVLDIIAMHFLKVRWPRGGDGPEAYRKFIADLKLTTNRYQWIMKVE